MAYVLKKKADFEFQIEGNEKVYTIPAVDTLSIDEVDALQQIQGSSDLNLIKDTFQKVFFDKCEGLGEAGLSDYQLLILLQAYQKEQGMATGES